MFKHLPFYFLLFLFENYYMLHSMDYIFHLVYDLEVHYVLLNNYQDNLLLLKHLYSLGVLLFFLENPLSNLFVVNILLNLNLYILSLNLLHIFQFHYVYHSSN